MYHSIKAIYFIIYVCDCMRVTLSTINVTYGEVLMNLMAACCIDDVETNDTRVMI